MDHYFRIKRLPVLYNANYVMENMLFGVLSRKKNFPSVSWVIIITQKIEKEE